VRRLIYTTNVIEGFNRQLRKVTKAKSVFPTDDSLLKMLYLAMMDITKKLTGRRQDWSVIHAQLAVYFAGRMLCFLLCLCPYTFRSVVGAGIRTVLIMDLAPDFGEEQRR
jgi:hypothetical protein